MKRRKLFIYTTLILMAFIFSMAACNQDEIQYGELQDLIGDKTIERIDYVDTSSYLDSPIETHKTSESINHVDTSNKFVENKISVGNEKKNMFDYVDTKCRVYSRTATDELEFSIIRDAYSKLKYKKVSENNIVVTASQDRIIIFFTDGTYLFTSVWYKFWYVEADGKIINYDGIMYFDSSQTDVLELAMRSGVTGVPYDSFEDYWATIAPNQF
ncbi:MAG TPA: hypothetical protein VJZ69_02125 [Clostridia bacterium]|nr:hypothetical protein [Clostridia bacterium]